MRLFFALAAVLILCGTADAQLFRSRSSSSGCANGSCAVPQRTTYATPSYAVPYSQPALSFSTKYDCPCGPACACVTADGGVGTCGSYACPANGGAPYLVQVTGQQPYPSTVRYVSSQPAHRFLSRLRLFRR